jgi:hypothetical protein
MTKEEIISKNINLTFDFVDYLIENPSEMEKIPNGCTIMFGDKPSNSNVLNVRKIYEFG